MTRPRWLALVSVLLSLAMAVAVASELARLEWRGLVALVPSSPLFWLVFALFYLATVIGDWVIFRRLWGRGPPRFGWNGFVALVRKQVYNDMLLAYLGEGAFLAWARGRAPAGLPLLGAVKDVAIQSALAGNLVTVALLAIAWPQVSEALLGEGGEAVVWSIVFVLALSLGLLLARRRVFTLARAELMFAFAVHTVRILSRAALGALAWHLLLPEVPLVWWLWLAALRQVVSRLPMVANKDLIFAGLAVLVLEEGALVAEAVAFTAALQLATNVLAGALLLAGDAAGLRGLARRPSREGGSDPA